MTSDGRCDRPPAARSRQPARVGDADPSIVAELAGPVGLEDALAILLALLDREPETFSRAAARWGGRLVLERRLVLVDARLALAALAALPGPGAGAGAGALIGLSERHGLWRVDELVGDWCHARWGTIEAMPEIPYGRVHVRVDEDPLSTLTLTLPSEDGENVGEVGAAAVRVYAELVGLPEQWTVHVEARSKSFRYLATAASRSPTAVPRLLVDADFRRCEAAPAGLADEPSDGTVFDEDLEELTFSLVPP